MADITPHNTNTESFELIASQTAGATSEAFTVPGNVGYSIFSDALAAGELVSVQAKRPDGTWITIKSGLLDSTMNEGAIFSHGLFRLAKTITAAPVGVYSYNTAFKRSGRG